MLISTKVHYNSQHPLKPKANPPSNFSRGLQMVEHKPEAVLGQARSETKKCQQIVIDPLLSPEGFCTIPNRKKHGVVSDFQLLGNLVTFTQHSITQYTCMKKVEFQNLTLRFLLAQG